jgi:UDP-N-acetylglucosamine--N-acetylmuramyl-(pentapeptide) pyrophosphoryl-undecaprenol N-acetylglucosamine transferase
MIDALPLMPEDLRRDLRVVHQTGKADVERVRAAYAGTGVDAEVHEFIHDMAETYRMSDLVLCRAGALTVSELSISRRGALLVPYPHAVDNHQERNAEELVKAGAGEMILEQDLDGTMLNDALVRLNRDRKGVQQMAWRSGSLARPEAATEVVDEMYRAAGMV